MHKCKSNVSTLSTFNKKTYQDFSFRAFEIAQTVAGVVRQQPPISFAPALRHLVANNSNFSSSKHFDGCHKHKNKIKDTVSNNCIQDSITKQLWPTYLE